MARRFGCGYRYPTANWKDARRSYMSKHEEFMRIAYFDCFSGVSGDMTLGALLACGADEAHFREGLAALSVGGYELAIQTVKREGITATDVDVKLLEVDQGHGRHLSDIASILEASALPE